MSLKVQVNYFAQLRELSGKTNEELEVGEGDTVSQLYMALAERYQFPLGLSDIRVAINEEFASIDHPLTSGDQIVFIPPVAGG